MTNQFLKLNYIKVNLLFFCLCVACNFIFSCQVDCKGSNALTLEREFHIVVQKSESVGNALIVDGYDYVKKKNDHIHLTSAFFNSITPYLNISDTVYKNKGEFLYKILKKDSIIVTKFYCDTLTKAPSDFTLRIFNRTGEEIYFKDFTDNKHN